MGAQPDRSQKSSGNGARRWSGGGGFGSGLASPLRQVDFAADHGVVFNGEAECADVAHQLTAPAKFNTAGGGNISLDFTLDEDVAGGQIGGNIGIGADRQPVLGELDGTFNAAVDDEIFASLYLTTDHNRLTNPRSTIVNSHLRVPSGQ
jgi:hypothetical protein